MFELAYSFLPHREAPSLSVWSVLMDMALVFGFRLSWRISPLGARWLGSRRKAGSADRNWCRIHAVRSITELCPRTKKSKIFGSTKRWSYSNPGILGLEGGSIFLAANQHNVRISSMRRYSFRHGDQLLSQIVVSSINPGQRKVRDWKPLLNSGATQRALRSDPRCARSPGGIQLSYSFASLDGPEPSQSQIATIVVSSNGKPLSSEEIISSPAGHQEKNWCPIETEASSRPLYVYSLDPADNAFLNSRFVELSDELIGESTLPRLRGGTPWVKLPGDYFVTIVHHTYFEPFRHYTHRFLLGKLQNRRLVVSLCSSEFCFNNVFDAEFASGLLVRDDAILVSYGYRNKEGWLAEIPLKGFEEKIGTWKKG